MFNYCVSGAALCTICKKFSSGMDMLCVGNSYLSIAPQIWVNHSMYYNSVPWIQVKLLIKDAHISFFFLKSTDRENIQPGFIYVKKSKTAGGQIDTCANFLATVILVWKGFG